MVCLVSAPGNPGQHPQAVNRRRARQSPESGARLKLPLRPAPYPLRFGHEYR